LSPANFKTGEDGGQKGRGTKVGEVHLQVFEHLFLCSALSDALG